MEYTMYAPHLNHLIFYIFRLTKPSKYDIDTKQLDAQLYSLGGRFVSNDKRALADLELLFRPSESL